MLSPSTRKNKRYMLVLPDKTIHFGLKGGETYIDHGDKVKRTNYLKRHAKNEDWTKPNPASSSAYILWGFTTDIQKNLDIFLKEMNYI